MIKEFFQRVREKARRRIRRQQKREEAARFPPVHFILPDDSRIEKTVISENEVLYYIPASRNSGGLSFFAILANAFSIVFATIYFKDPPADNPERWVVPLFCAIFICLGLGTLIAAMKLKYARHHLHLVPEYIRLQVQFLSRSKNHDLLMSEDPVVSLEVFYEVNYQPISGVQIRGKSGRKIRFGSTLKEKEKLWLYSEIKRHIEERSAVY